MSPQAPSSGSVCAASGGGRTGKGCVGADSSPGTRLAGTARSSIGKSGSPVSRFSTKSIPILVPWITAGIRFPSRAISLSVGWEATS